MKDSEAGSNVVGVVTEQHTVKKPLSTCLQKLSLFSLQPETNQPQ